MKKKKLITSLTSLGAVVASTSMVATACDSSSKEEEVTYEVTYKEICKLRNTNALVPGRSYRITDYECIVASSDEYKVEQSNVFDIIVTAATTNQLNENCRAVLHKGDKYFSRNALEVWEIKYTIDNDKSLYDWANLESGKGVIYYMKDEFGNECPYDFKNIQFQPYYNSSMSVQKYNNGYYCYTFSSEYSENDIDYSLGFDEDGGMVNVFDNKIERYVSTIATYPAAVLNNIVFFGNFNFQNTIGTSCRNMTFNDTTIGNNIGKASCDITTEWEFKYNTIGSNCVSMSFGKSCDSNTIGNNSGVCSFDKNCSNNTIGSVVTYCSFGYNFSYNTVGNGCTNITVNNKNRSEYQTYSTINDGTKNIVIDSVAFYHSTISATYGLKNDPIVFNKDDLWNTYIYNGERLSPTYEITNTKWNPDPQKGVTSTSTITLKKDGQQVAASDVSWQILGESSTTEFQPEIVKDEQGNWLLKIAPGAECSESEGQIVFSAIVNKVVVTLTTISVELKS